MFSHAQQPQQQQHVRTDFSGLFSRSLADRDDQKSVDFALLRRRPREISPLQFEPEFDDEMSMDALHFFGLSSSPSLSSSSASGTSDRKRRRRRRHFSLENYHYMDMDQDDDDFDDDDSSSNSCHQRRIRIVQNVNVNHASSDDSASFSSFLPSMNESSFSSSDEVHPNHHHHHPCFSNANLSSCMSLELENEHIVSQLRNELECRLLETLSPNNADLADGARARNKYIFEFPPHLLSIIAGHIIQDASKEPYGIKGCLLHIYYESECDVEFISSLDCDPDTVKTFELTLTLRQGTDRKRSWINKLPSLVRSFSNFAFGNVVVGTSYKLVKKRNYRSQENEPEGLLC